MNLKKYKRFFAFGCSFTWYNWYTWADAIAKDVPESYNYGRPGAGNQYIFSSIVEANIRHKFNSDDLVIVMWTGVDREDRYINNQWKSLGCIYHSAENFYDKNFIMKYADDRGFFIRDLTAISATNKILENIDHYYLSMVPLGLESDDRPVDTDLMNFFYSEYKDMKPSVFETVYKNNWMSIPHIKRKDDKGKEYKDMHPTPRMHLSYIQTVFPELTLSNESIDMMNQYEDKIRSMTYFDNSFCERPYIQRL